MRNSNKVLLIAVGALLAFVLAFVLVMGLTMKGLMDRRGRTAQASFSTIPVERALLLPRGLENHRLVIL
ncbi:MAG: hypothetical protein KAR73_01560 [Spirochaetales bacterium]|jgi:hypothetical protein|nr:hypothetical protein [Spirochaetales bacterium]